MNCGICILLTLHQLYSLRALAGRPGCEAFSLSFCLKKGFDMHSGKVILRTVCCLTTKCFLLKSIRCSQCQNVSWSSPTTERETFVVIPNPHFSPAFLKPLWPDRGPLTQYWWSHTWTLKAFLCVSVKSLSVISGDPRKLHLNQDKPWPSLWVGWPQEVGEHVVVNSEPSVLLLEPGQCAFSQT